MTVGAGIIGLGFMGRVHAAAYLSLGAELLGVFDRSAAEPVDASGNIDSASGGPDLGGVCRAESVDELLAMPGLELVSVCTPTDTHVDVAIDVLRAGKHVLIEKPVALDLAGIERLAVEAERAERLCMPGMCMRFWPAWAWVKRAIEERRFGSVRGMRMERLGAAPSWNRSFYADESRCGGALFDLHIHDADFVLHTLGMPESVHAVGTAGHVACSYRFDDGPTLVCAHGGWIGTRQMPFSMRLLVEFEGAVADFQLGRQPEFAVYPADGSTLTPVESIATGWHETVAAMLGAVRAGSGKPPVTLADAADVTRLLLAERASLERGGPVSVR